MSREVACVAANVVSLVGYEVRTSRGKRLTEESRYGGGAMIENHFA